MVTRINMLGPGIEAEDYTYDFYGKDIYSPIGVSFENISYGKMELYTYDKKGVTKKDRNRIIFFKTLPHIVPTSGDIAYWLMRCNYIFEEVETNGDKPVMKTIDANAHYLKEKTLLICKDDLQKNVTDGSIRKTYPFAFKIVSQEEFDRAVIAKENDKCVLEVLQVDGPISWYTQEIMDLSSSEIAAMGMTKVVVAGVGGLAYKYVKEEHLQKYAEGVK